jgi:hypothetical protein
MMRLNKLRALLPGVAAAAGIVGLLSVTTTARAQQKAYAIGNGGSSLITFNTNSPTAASSVGNFTLNGSAFFLDAIDFRPLDGQLYGFRYQNDNGTPISTLYRVNTNNGVLTQIAAGGNAASTNLLGMDFNPMIDRVRVVTDDADNLVYNPASAAAPTVASPLEYAVGDINFGKPAHVLENAYTNNIAGAISTTQYVIDYQLGILATLNNNLGQLTTIGSLGVNINQSVPLVGFDIFTTLGGVNTAYAILDTSATGANANLYTINLGTGAATSIGAVSGVTGGRFGQVYSLAVTPTSTAPEPGSLALVMGGMATMGLSLYRRRRKS